METKKVLGIIFSLLFVGAFAFVLSWGIINFNKVKDGMSGTGVYTKEDINKSYEDGYNTALTDKEEYTKLIASYRDTITTLNDNISQLNSQVTTLTNNNKDYANQLTQLNEQKTNLQSQVDNLTTIKTNNETTIASLNNQITSLQNQVTNLTKSGEDKSEQIKTLNSQITTLQNTVSQLQITNDMNVATITSLNTQIASLNTQIANLNNQIDSLNSQITVLQNDITNKETTISDMQKTVTDLNNKIFELEKKIDYTITYTVGEDVTTKTAKGHTTITLLDKPTKTDLTFDGWYYDGNKIETTTFDITNTDISIIGYFKCLVTCGNDTTLVDVGSSVGSNSIIPLGVDGVVYTYYLNNDKNKCYTYDEICSLNFTKNSTISYELVSNVPDIDYSYGGRFSDWSKTDLSSPFNSVQAIQFTFDKTNNGGQCFFDTTSGSYQSTFDIVFDESLKVYCFVTTVNNQFKFTGIFALKRGLSGDNISTLANSQNYAWHFGFGASLSAVVGENCEFNSNIFALKSLCYIFSANIDGSYDTNMA